MDTMTQWIIVAVATVLIWTVAAVVLYMILGSRQNSYANSVSQCGFWSVELWNIRYGYRLNMTFHSALTIGRNNLFEFVSGPLPPQMDLTISREHCMLYDQDGMLLLWNLSAVNPIVLNGYRLNTPRRLNPGDRLELGDSVYMVTRVDHVV